jgi:hypothetical protein
MLRGVHAEIYSKHYTNSCPLLCPLQCGVSLTRNIVHAHVTGNCPNKRVHCKGRKCVVCVVCVVRCFALCDIL